MQNIVFQHSTEESRTPLMRASWSGVGLNQPTNLYKEPVTNMSCRPCRSSGLLQGFSWARGLA